MYFIMNEEILSKELKKIISKREKGEELNDYEIILLDDCENRLKMVDELGVWARSVMDKVEKTSSVIEGGKVIREEVLKYGELERYIEAVSLVDLGDFWYFTDESTSADSDQIALTTIFCMLFSSEDARAKALWESLNNKVPYVPTIVVKRKILESEIFGDTEIEGVKVKGKSVGDMVSDIKYVTEDTIMAWLIGTFGGCACLLVVILYLILK